jgi:hypothetical protein
MLTSLGRELQNLAKPGLHSPDDDNNERNQRHQ